MDDHAVSYLLIMSVKLIWHKESKTCRLKKRCPFAPFYLSQRKFCIFGEKLHLFCSVGRKFLYYSTIAHPIL